MRPVAAAAGLSAGRSRHKVGRGGGCRRRVVRPVVAAAGLSGRSPPSQQRRTGSNNRTVVWEGGSHRGVVGQVAAASRLDVKAAAGSWGEVAVATGPRRQTRKAARQLPAGRAQSNGLPTARAAGNGGVLGGRSAGVNSASARKTRGSTAADQARSGSIATRSSPGPARSRAASLHRRRLTPLPGGHRSPGRPGDTGPARDPAGAERVPGVPHAAEGCGGCCRRRRGAGQSADTAGAPSLACKGATWESAPSRQPHTPHRPRTLAAW